MKISIELNTESVLDYKALLALTQIISGETKEAVAVEEEKTPKYECTATAMPLEEAPEEKKEPQPAEEPAQEKEIPAESAPTMSVEEWKSVLLAKRIELGLYAKDGTSEGPLASQKSLFNDYVKENAAAYGANSPINLTPENRYKFVTEVFNNICYDPITGFGIEPCPCKVLF